MKTTIEHLQEQSEVLFDENTVIAIRYRYYNRENEGYQAEIYSFAEEPYGSMWSSDRRDRIECELRLEKCCDEYFKTNLEAMRWALKNA